MLTIPRRWFNFHANRFHQLHKFSIEKSVKYTKYSQSVLDRLNGLNRTLTVCLALDWIIWKHLMPCFLPSWGNVFYQAWRTTWFFLIKSINHLRFNKVSKVERKIPKRNWFNPKTSGAENFIGYIFQVEMCFKHIYEI